MNRLSLFTVVIIVFLSLFSCERDGIIEESPYKTPESLPEGVRVTDGVLYKWACEAIPADGKVVIPDFVTEIHKYAFIDCTNLLSIVFGKNVITIGYNAFKGCTGLSTISIPSNVQTINRDAFEGCTGVSVINFAEGIKSISGFKGCTGLSSIVIPKSVTRLDDAAFEGCTGLLNIELNENLTL